MHAQNTLRIPSYKKIESKMTNSGKTESGKTKSGLTEPGKTELVNTKLSISFVAIFPLMMVQFTVTVPWDSMSKGFFRNL